MANEKRLIDADALLEFAINRYGGIVIPSDINTFPTVDAVEVVRCKDCFANSSCSVQVALDMGEQGYCSKGRREERQWIK